MAKLSLLAGTTSKLIDIFIQDTSVTTGAGLTGLTSGSSGLTWYYYREGANASVSVAAQAMTLGTWTTRGFIVVDGTNMPGVYQLGVPDAALAAGAKSVVMLLKGVTNMAAVVLEIELTAVDNQDATKFGLTNLDATVSSRLASGSYTAPSNLTAAQIATGVWQDTTAGDFTVSASIGKSVMNGVALGTGLTVNDITTKTGYSLSQSFPSNFSSLGITAGGHITTVDTVTTVTNQLTAAAIATGVWTDTTAGDFTTSLSVGKSVMNGVSLGTGLTVAAVASGGIAAATFASGALDAVWSTAARTLTAGTNIQLPSNGLANVTSWTVAITGNITGNLSGSVGSVTGLTASNLDAAVSSRMATYTQPTGFLAATFPSDPADQSLIIAATDALASLIGDVPTNAELTSALDGADDATLAAIAALTIPTANQNADALLDRVNGVEVGLTPRQTLRLSAAADAGKLSGAATTTNTIRNAVADSKDRIVATVDSDGNRTAITYDLS